MITISLHQNLVICLSLHDSLVCSACFLGTLVWEFYTRRLLRKLWWFFWCLCGRKTICHCRAEQIFNPWAPNVCFIKFAGKAFPYSSILEMVQLSNWFLKFVNLVMIPSLSGFIYWNAYRNSRYSRTRWWAGHCKGGTYCHYPPWIFIGYSSWIMILTFAYKL